LAEHNDKQRKAGEENMKDTYQLLPHCKSDGILLQDMKEYVKEGRALHHYKTLYRWVCHRVFGMRTDQQWLHPTPSPSLSPSPTPRTHAAIQTPHTHTHNTSRMNTIRMEANFNLVDMFCVAKSKTDLIGAQLQQKGEKWSLLGLTGEERDACKKEVKV
jgi:hypothetical protein